MSLVSRIIRRTDFQGLQRNQYKMYNTVSK